MKRSLYKLVVFVPQNKLEQVRIAMSNAGAGKMGKYDNCFFMTSGIGTYRPLKGSNPYRGRIGKLERVGEARLEVTIPKNKLEQVISAMKKAHPYEVIAYDIYKLENF
ncbi:MAG: hypothetical protein ABH860_05910 [bacterium]